MSLYQRVFSAADLPPVGASWESPSCDFKSDADPARFTEMAKDIAALANGTGGVIVVKATERNGRLVRYLPMPPDEADALRSAFQRAAKDHCVPSPRLQPESIPFDDGVVLAINVDAYAAQPVGVKAIPVKQHTNDKFGPCFMFPIRVTDGTKFLTPQDLGTLMLPEIRKAAILLDQLSTRDRSGMAVMWQTGPVGTERLDADLVGVDVLNLTFELLLATSPPANVRLPLDAFRVLADDHSQGTPRKRLHIHGALVRSGPSQRYQWTPTYR